MLTLLRVPRLNKNSKSSNGQELEKTLEESKETDSKRKENKGNGMVLVFQVFFCFPSNSDLHAHTQTNRK